MDMKYCQHCGAQISSQAEICPKCGVRVPTVSDVETQRTLLRLYGEQLVAHAASFFAALGSAMFFTYYFRPHLMLSWKSGIYLGIASGLFTLAAYIFFRLMLYGRLAYLAVAFAPNWDETLLRYQERVIKEMWKESETRGCVHRCLSSFLYTFEDVDTWRCLVALAGIFLVGILVVYLLA
jgi:hypothetical protein